MPVQASNTPKTTLWKYAPKDAFTHTHALNCKSSHIVPRRVYSLTYECNHLSTLDGAVAEEDSGGSAALACGAAPRKLLALIACMSSAPDLHNHSCQRNPKLWQWQHVNKYSHSTETFKMSFKVHNKLNQRDRERPRYMVQIHRMCLTRLLQMSARFNFNTIGWQHTPMTFLLGFQSTWGGSWTSNPV